MSTDRELLTLAAKAAGMKLVYAPDDGPCRGCQFIDGKSAAWNPLTNDGDALRLAVKRRIELVFSKVSVSAVQPYMDVCVTDDFGDERAATRRAIVRAAAAIGEQMP